MAVRKFDYDYPAISRTREQVVDDTRANLIALADSILCGAPINTDATNGWQLSTTTGTGSAEFPQYRYWTNSANTQQVLRAEFGYTGSYYVTSITWTWSETGIAGSYSALFTTTCAYDGSSNLSTGNNSFLLSWLFEVVGKLKTLYNNVSAHVALNVSAGVHGAGTLASQNATNVNIDGGAIDGTPIGASTPAAGTFTRASELPYTNANTGSLTLDWAYGGTDLTNASGCTITGWTNVPSGVVATHIVFCANFDSTTFPGSVNWGSGGKPTLGAGKDGVASLITKNAGTNVIGTVIWKEA